MSVFQTELFSVVKSRVCTHVPLGNQHACHDTLHKCTSTWNKWSSCKDIEKGYRTYMGEKTLKWLLSVSTIQFWMQASLVNWI